MRRGHVGRCVGTSGRARSGFPYDLADRDGLRLAGYVLLAFVLVHALVLVSEAQIRDEVMDDFEHPEVDEVNNLPATLARFLAERRDMPGFTYQMMHDENRGWIILWKKFAQSGSVRGSGQFYERPYAWIDE